MKAVERLQMNIFWLQTIKKSCSKFFSETSYCSKTCSSRPGLSIAPTLVRFGHVQTIKDTIKKWILKAPEAPLKKRTYLRPSELGSNTWWKSKMCNNIECIPYMLMPKIHSFFQYFITPSESHILELQELFIWFWILHVC